MSLTGGVDTGGRDELVGDFFSVGEGTGCAFLSAEEGETEREEKAFLTKSNGLDSNALPLSNTHIHAQTHMCDRHETQAERTTDCRWRTEKGWECSHLALSLGCVGAVRTGALITDWSFGAAALAIGICEGGLRKPPAESRGEFIAIHSSHLSAHPS